MKKIVFITSFIVLFLFSTSALFAQTRFSSGQNSILSKKQTVNGNYFATGNTVTISGTVNGDAYAAGGKIIIDGKINGDLLAAGGTITVNGPVTGNIRAVGGNLTVSSQIGRNITLGGGNLNLTKSAQVSGSAVLAGGNLDVFAPVSDGITLAGGNATIDSTVQGDINSAVGKLNVNSNAVVNGNITYWSNQKASIENGASVSGRVRQNIPPQSEKDKTRTAAKGFLTGLFIFLKLASLLSALILGTLFLKFYPLKMSQTTSILNTSPGRSFLIGLLTVILIPFLIVALFITLLGIPLALITLVIYVLLLFFAKIFVSYALTERILNPGSKKPTISSYLILLIGLVAYEIITALPIIGGLLAFVGVCLGIGAYLIEQKEYHETLKAKKLA